MCLIDLAFGLLIDCGVIMFIFVSWVIAWLFYLWVIVVILFCGFVVVGCWVVCVCVLFDLFGLFAVGFDCFVIRFVLNYFWILCLWVCYLVLGLLLVFLFILVWF